MASGWNVGAGELRASPGGLGHAPVTSAHGPQKGTEVERGEGATKMSSLVTEGRARGQPKETQGKWVCPSQHHSLPKPS